MVHGNPALMLRPTPSMLPALTAPSAPPCRDQFRLWSVAALPTLRHRAQLVRALFVIIKALYM